MAEDVKTLRWAAEMFKREQPMANDEWAKMMNILCRVVADMIEREAQPKHGTFREHKDAEVFFYPTDSAPTSDALQAAEDRGWNEAMMQVQQVIQAYKDRMDTALLGRKEGANRTIPECKADAARTLLEAVAALCRPPSTPQQRDR